MTKPTCSFCSKGQVEYLIAAPGGVYICDKCTDLCADIISVKRYGQTRAQAIEGVYKLAFDEYWPF